ncbi:MAG: hypothetical protein AAFP20_18445, partial [Cyanobacteria bacterium J06614_10]
PLRSSHPSRGDLLQALRMFVLDPLRLHCLSRSLTTPSPEQIPSGGVARSDGVGPHPLLPA